MAKKRKPTMEKEYLRGVIKLIMKRKSETKKEGKKRVGGHEVKFRIPAKWEKNWAQLLKFSGKSEQELVLDLIEDEVVMMGSKEEKDSYDRMEDAAKEVHENLGADGLSRFSKEVRLVAKKLVEATRG